MCVSLWLVLVVLTCFLLRSLALNTTGVVNFKCSFYTLPNQTCYGSLYMSAHMKGKGDRLARCVTGTSFIKSTSLV